MINKRLHRGAIAFAMVAEYEGPYNKRFYDCVIVVILFTTLVQVAKKSVQINPIFDPDQLIAGDSGEAPGGGAGAEEGQGEEPKDPRDSALPGVPEEYQGAEWTFLMAWQFLKCTLEG